MAQAPKSQQTAPQQQGRTPAPSQQQQGQTPSNGQQQQGTTVFRDWAAI